MFHRKLTVRSVLMLILIALSVTVVSPGIFKATPRATASPRPANAVLAHALDIALGKVAPGRPHRPTISSGPLQAMLSASGALEERAAALKQQGKKPQLPNPLHGGNSRSGNCANRYSGHGSVDIRVNQDCSYYMQSEEAIAVNPTDRENLIVGYNDFQLGGNSQCGFAWSMNGGDNWGSSLLPVYTFPLLGNSDTPDSCSDPTVAFDSDGNAYYGGIIFNFFSPNHNIVVEKSNAGVNGRFYHSPDATLDDYQLYRAFPMGVVVSETNELRFTDKELMAADASRSSPKRNNVYVTWTWFDFDSGHGEGISAPIYFSQSTDGGANWSDGVEISGRSTTFCNFNSGEADPNACDQDQGSHPTVGRDGTVYVTFANYNASTDFAHSQVLLVKCPATANCSNAASWSAPSKVGDMNDDLPLGPDPVTGCFPGAGCLPPNGYRTGGAGSTTVSVDNNGKVYVTWSDFRNAGPNCQGDATTATPPCDNDIYYAYSTNGGTTWSNSYNITPASRFDPTAQWQPWSDVSPDGSTLWVGYYDRSYGDCEFEGCNDITLAKITNPATGSPRLRYTRLTSNSMPNLTAADNPYEAGFLGDYMWVTTDSRGKAYVVWGDTRGLDDSADEDVYFATGP